MAKKNSSKTATEKALTAANPRIQVFNKWAGVNFKDAPLGWEYEEPNKFYAHHQTDLPLNNFVIQNNLVTDMSDTVSTRNDSSVIARAIDGLVFTGVMYLYRHWLFAVMREPNWVPDNPVGYRYSYDELYYRDINIDDTWHIVYHNTRNGEQEADSKLPIEISEIGNYENKLIVLSSSYESPKKSIVYTSDIEYDPDTDTISGQFCNSTRPLVVSERHVSDPITPPDITVVGFPSDEYFIAPNPSATPPAGSKATERYSFVYTYTNMWGTTTQSQPAVVWLSVSPYSLTGSKYIKLDCHNDATINQYITGVDVWVNINENQDYTLATHSNSSATGAGPVINWFGAMTNTDLYSEAASTLPQENTTEGPDARYFDHIDSRLYWWGGAKYPYRLLIGGNVGNEFSISRSFGGGWVDIEPGSGYVVQGVCKWKTAQAANIVTILCGHPNTNQVKRFNLIEMTSTFTNEIVVKGWQYEEVSNVVGCNSRWGFGVFVDGLYTVDRYGLMLTTMAAEYNNQMRNMKVSENIDPIFTERLGHRLNDARLVHIDGVIYIILSEDNSEDEPQNLDRVILCYDIGKKAWYTFTHDGNDGLLLHAIAIDSERHVEGLGIISEHAVTLYPTTGIQECSRPDFNILLETGELCSRIPMQAPYYVEQLEFRFDYFIGNCDCIIEGVDYYGRKFTIIKQFGKSVKACGGVDEEKRMYSEWVRVQKLVEFMRITIKGPARFRMTHIINKAYLYNNLIGMPYGFDAQDTFINRAGKEESIHHYIKDYNNLRRAIVS